MQSTDDAQSAPTFNNVLPAHLNYKQRSNKNKQPL